MISLRERIIRYGLAGLLATGIYFVSVWILVGRAGVDPVAGAVAATAILVVTSYVVNRAFVFDTNRAHRSAFTRFVIASLLSFAVNSGLMALATKVFSWRYLVGAALTILVVPPMNFVVNQFWTFSSTD